MSLLNHGSQFAPLSESLRDMRNYLRLSCHINKLTERTIMKSSTGNNVVKFNGKFYSRREGSRLTDCCQAYSTFFDDELVCKVCYRNVEFGEGDGSECVDVSALPSQ